jgi:hypothetical protein
MFARPSEHGMNIRAERVLQTPRSALTTNRSGGTIMAKTGVCSIPGCIKLGILRRGLCEPHYDRLMRHGDPLAGGTFRGEPLAWLHAHAGHEGVDCLVWPYGIRGQGRGSVKYGGKDVWAHRLMCELAHGPAPSDGHEAAHGCGKGHEACVTPQHLRWATRQENQGDKVQHGTSNRGSRSPFARLSEQDVRIIKSLKGKVRQRDLAERFGVAIPTIGSIHSGKTWAWVN